MTLPRIRTDVFPVRVQVTRPGEATPLIFEKCRIVMTTDQVYIFQDSPRGPEAVYTETISSYDPGVPVHRRTRGTPSRMPEVTTESGDTVTFVKSGGCGCGSRLKSFNPFSQISAVTGAASTRDR